MVSRRSIVVLVIVALTAASQAGAQVRPLGEVHQKSEVQQASCYSDCGSVGCGSHCGTVWGATCMDPCSHHPGLYPPCPNPCRTTLVGELLLDVKHAVCTSLSHIFCCTFGTCGMSTCARCGPCVESYDCCSGCDSCVGGTYVDGCADCGTTASGCGCQGGSMQVSPLEVGQPAPSSVQPQSNPFRDDPQGTGAVGVQQTTRTRSILPAPRAAKHPPARTRSVRRASHQEAVSGPVSKTKRPSESRSASRTASVPQRRSLPQRPTTLRRANGAELQPVPQASDGESALRFRDVP